MLLKMRGQFSKRHETDIQALVSLAAEGDREELKKKTHMLKGLTATLQMEPLNEKIVRLEQMLENHADKKELEKQAEDIEQEYKSFVRIQNRRQDAAKNITDRPADIQQSYDSAAFELCGLLEFADFTAWEFWEQKEEIFRNHMEKDSFSSLKSKIENMEFQKALEILDNCEERKAGKTMQKYQVLFVDDDRAAGYIVSRFKVWEESDFTLKSIASSSTEALKLLEKEFYDLVITDIRMPGMDGLELIRVIREKY